MKEITLSEAVSRSVKLRELYHQLELKYHGSEWTVQEDALAFLTDAGLVGRLTMSVQGRWPVSENAEPQLEHKLGECIWWLIVMADRMDIDIQNAFDGFLSRTEKLLKK